MGKRGRNENGECMLHSGSMDRKELPLIFLISGLAFVFARFGIDKFVHPTIWIGFLPPWMDGLAGIPNTLWILLIGGLELLFAVMIVIPVRRIRQAGAALMALHLLGIVSQMGWNDVTVRDIGLLLSSLALLAML